MDKWVQGLLTGISLGSAYALLAIGVSVVYKASKDINLSHGAIAMVVGLILAHEGAEGWPPVVRILVGLVLGTLVAAVVYFGVLVPFAHRSPVTRLTALVAVLFGAGGLMQWKYGTDTAILPPLWNTRFQVLGGTFSGQQLLTVLMASAGAIVLGLVFAKTMYGWALRGMADDAYGAQSVGVRPQLMLLSAMVIAGAFAGLAAALIVPQTGVSHLSGFSWTLLAVTGAVVGGIASFWGSALGGLVLGLTHGLMTVAAPEYFVAAQFILLIVVLAARPRGLAGDLAI